MTKEQIKQETEVFIEENCIYDKNSRECDYIRAAYIAGSESKDEEIKELQSAIDTLKNRLEEKEPDNVPKYDPCDIFDAIQKEGLCAYCYGFKTPTCIWVYIDGMEKEEVWDKFPPSLKGYEQAFWDNNKLEEVAYFMLTCAACS